MSDFDLGYQHGYNNGGDRGIKKYPNNANYLEGFKDGDHARVFAPTYNEPDYLGADDTTPD